MDRFTDLDAILDHVWTFVEDGPGDFHHPFATPTFVTDGANVRTVTLRKADAATRTLTFHSDARAAKIDELHRDPLAAFHVWDAEHRQQIILHGTATVHTDDDLADRIWHQEPPPALALYLKPKGPDTPVEAPPSGLALPASKARDELTREDVAEGRPRFAVVQTVVDRVDWLHAHPEGHYRARFAWNDGDLDSAWIVP